MQQTFCEKMHKVTTVFVIGAREAGFVIFKNTEYLHNNYSHV